MENLDINILTQLTESRPRSEGACVPLFLVKVLRLQRWFIRGSGLTKPSCTKGRKRHTALDTFDLVLRVVVTAASVPEREAIAQVLSFGLPDGAKGLTAVYGQAIRLSCYPLPLFIQPLRLGLNQPATARSHSLQPRSTFSPNCPIVKFCDIFYLVALDTELSVIVRERKKRTAQH